MTDIRGLAFGALVLASFAAFFVSQRLKSSPTVISDITFESHGTGNYFSPNGDGRRDTMLIGFTTTKADSVTVAVLNAGGDEIRRLIDGRQLAAGERVRRLPWDGRDDRGRLVVDGRYRVRISLTGQGRAFVSQRSIIKDTTPPRPRVASIGPERGPGPEILPHRDGSPARVRFTTPALVCPQVRIYRTAPGRPRLVFRTSLPVGTQTFLWSGLVPKQAPNPVGSVCGSGPPRSELEQGVPSASSLTSPAQAGTYVIVAEWRDVAGNIGHSIPLDRKTLLPRRSSKAWPGHGGVVVRRLAIRTPVTAVTAGSEATFDVDARGRRYRWSMRMLGDRQISRRARTSSRSAKIVTPAPGRSSALYLLTVATGKAQTTVPFAVQGSRSVAGDQGAPRGVLVLLPQTTWAGEIRSDEDGDGQPDTLRRGLPTPLQRFQTGLPQGMREMTAPVLVWLARQRRRFDLATDVELLGQDGPQLDTYAGVLIADDMRWLSASVRDRLVRYVRSGGTVVSLGTGSLRRTVTLDSGQLVRPSADRVTDIFGARLRPLVSEPTSLTIDRDERQLSLFEGGSGRFATVDRYEETIDPGGELLAAATTSRPSGRLVITAARVGKGVVIRPGIAAFGSRLLSDDDPATTALMERMWALLSR